MRPNVPSTVAIVAVVCGLGLPVGPAEATPPPEVAERFHVEALELAGRGRWKAAIKRWRKAEAIQPDWRYAFNLASSYAHVRKWQAAWDALGRAREGGIVRGRRAAAADLDRRISDKLLKTHAEIRLALEPSAASVTLDGKPWKPPYRRWTSRPRHTLVVTHRGYRPEERVWSHPRGGRYVLDVQLKPLTPRDPRRGWEVLEKGPVRVNHTATLLQSGEVLIAAGRGPKKHKRLATAVRFDPASERFQPTGPLKSAREHHTATRLRDGRVLVIGGLDHPRTLDTTELFDPTSGSWSPGPPLLAPRFDHGAVLLSSGEVLVVGGAEDAKGYASMAIFEPEPMAWRVPSVTLPAPLASVAAIALPGDRVLICGGRDGGTYSKRVLIYDVRASVIRELADGLQTARAWVRPTRLGDGRILLTGGFCKDCSMDTDHIFDPNTEDLVRIAHGGRPPEAARLVTLHDGRAMLVGGWHRHGRYRSEMTMIYSVLRGGHWRMGPVLADPRVDHTSTVLKDGSVFVCGGRSPRRAFAETALLYRP